MKSRRSQPKNCKSWIKLRSLKYGTRLDHGFSELVQINPNEFVVAVDTKGLYKYGSNNKWTKFITLPKNFGNKCTLSFDTRKQILYLFSTKGKMAEIDINTRNYTITKKLLCTHAPFSIVIDSKVHIIDSTIIQHHRGFATHSKFTHLLWNPIIKKLKQVNNITNPDGSINGVVYIQQKHMLLFIYSNHLSKYDFDNNTYIDMDQRIDINTDKQMGYVITRDGRYMILLDKIYSDTSVFDLETLNVRMSRVQCPAVNIGFHKAVLMDNTYRYMTLLLGYIREHYHTQMPEDVLQLMLMWSLSHDIHLLLEDGSHWRIDVHEILAVDN